MIIDFININTKKELHLLLKKELLFPDFYGCNWDAFWDSITAIVEMPLNITFRNYHYLESILPVDAKIFRKCISDFLKEYNQNNRYNFAFE